MEKIPTAEELLKSKETYEDDYPTVSISDAHEAMIEFAKLHVEQALKEASEKGKCSNGTSVVLKNSILNSYPLSNIK